MTRHPFSYAVLRVVPRVERGEAINAGVLLYCQPMDFLGSRTHLSEDHSTHRCDQHNDCHERQETSSFFSTFLHLDSYR